MYNTYADEIYRYCLSHSSDSDLSEDIVSETFMKAWKHFDTFDNKHPRAWLYTIAKNLFRDHWRKNQLMSLMSRWRVIRSRTIQFLLQKKHNYRKSAEGYRSFAYRNERCSLYEMYFGIKRQAGGR